MSWENLHSHESFHVWITGALGVDCVNLGLGFPNRSSNPPSLSESGGVNKGETDFENNLFLHMFVDLLVSSSIPSTTIKSVSC